MLIFQPGSIFSDNSSDIIKKNYNITLSSFANKYEVILHRLFILPPIPKQ
jgi:hypothetical protein